MSRKFLASALAGLVLLSGSAGLAAEPLGTAEQAKALLDRAIAALKTDEAAALKQFNDENNKNFRERDLFVYCFSTNDGKFTAYESPFLLGADIRELKLYGEPMGKQAFDLVHDAPEGKVVTIEFKMPKPGTKTPSPKEAYLTRVGHQGCAVSYFK